MLLERLDTAIAFAVVMLGVSLLITILTQMVSSLFGFRGAYLKGGIRQLIETVSPKLSGSAGEIAKDILTHPLVSDSIFSNCKWIPERWRLASAIRPNELIRALKRVAASNKNDEKSAIEDALDEISPELERQVKLVTSVLNTAGVQTTASADALLAKMSEAGALTAGRIEAAFQTVMDRVSQRFAMQMRIWTVIFAAVLAVTVQLDSFRLFRRIASDPSLRSGLVGVSDSMLKQAAETLGPEERVPALYQHEMQRMSNERPELTLTDPPPFPSRDDAAAWLKQQLGGRQDAAPAVRDYDSRVDRALEQLGKRLSDRYASIERMLETTGVDFSPKRPTLATLRGMPGILVTIAFLSLGAPFWFNALKGLTNLRPILAQRASKETSGSRQGESS